MADQANPHPVQDPQTTDALLDSLNKSLCDLDWEFSRFNFCYRARDPYSTNLNEKYRLCFEMHDTVSVVEEILSDVESIRSRLKSADLTEWYMEGDSSMEDASFAAEQKLRRLGDRVAAENDELRLARLKIEEVKDDIKATIESIYEGNDLFD